MKHFPHHNARGFVILFTILISAIILLIGFGIFSIASRETVLSGTSREAQAAFYAADAGMECALYAQLSNVLIAGGQLDCGGIPITVSGSGTPLLPFVFDVMVDADAKTCAHVTIFDTTTLTGAARRVLSQGYNVCTAQGLAATKNPILVERLLDTIYTFGGAITATPTGSGTGKTDIDPDFVPGGGGVLNLPPTPLSAPSSSAKPQ